LVFYFGVTAHGVIARGVGSFELIKRFPQERPYIAVSSS
jgi:hypothetical protein